MEKIKAIVELTRPRNMVISFLGVIVGAILVSSQNTIELKTVTAAISAMLILGAGNALNDYYDSSIDKINQPKRPIPSGRISKKEAKAITLILFLSGILLAASINASCLILATLNAIILTIYAKHSKQALALANLAVSYLTASVFIYGALTVIYTQEFNLIGIPILGALVLSSFLMTLSREIIKDIEDMPGDKKAKARTLPIEVGKDKAKTMAKAAGLLAIIASLMPFLQQTENFSNKAYAVFIIPANLIFISSYGKEPRKNQKQQVHGILISLIAFLAGRILG